MIQVQFKPVIKQYAVIIIANFTMLYVGLSTTWSSPVLVKLTDSNQTILPQSITDEEASWIVALPPLCGALVIFVTGYIVDHLGRKMGIVLVCVPRMLVYLLYLFANDTWMIFMGRCIGGVCNMLTMSVTPIYASEIANKEIRGALGTISQIVSAVGMLIMLTVGPYTSYFTLNLVCLCVVVVLSVPMIFLPESPYYLYAKGKIDDSIKVLTFLRGSEELAREELQEYALSPDLEVKKMEILKNKVVLKTLLKVIILGTGLQTTGFTTLSFYLQTIFKSTHTSVSPEISSVVIGCIQLLACFCTILVTDRFGRKPILITSLTGTAIGMIGLGVYFKLTGGHHDVTGFMNYLPLISIILITFCFNLGMGSLIWIVVAEMFDGPTRAFGVSLSMMMTMISSFLVIKYFGAVSVAIGPSAIYWIFGAICILMGVFIQLFIPETTGKTFSQIQNDLGRNDVKLKGNGEM